MTFVSSEPPEVVKKSLEAAVDTGLFIFSSPAKPFNGEVYANGFKVRLAPGFLGQNTVLAGQLVPSATGTTIEVMFRLRLGMAAFLAVWFGVGLTMWSLFMVSTLRQLSGLSSPMRGPPAMSLAALSVMLLFVYFAFAVGPFWWVLKKAPSLLCKTLNCQERQET
jgi:hypothetical protein